MLERSKAWLVAKGFQQTPKFIFRETFNPMIKESIVRIILALAAHFNWKVKQLDINNAFLNGHLQDSVFMNQPKGFEESFKPTHVCKLIEAIYDLK